MNTDTSQEFDIKVNNHPYHVTTFGDVDLILYKIFDGNNFRFTIGMNGDAKWELVADNNGNVPSDDDNKLVQEIGNAIEQHDA